MYDSGLTLIDLRTDAPARGRRYRRVMRLLRLLTHRAADVFVVAIAVGAVVDVWQTAGSGSRIGLSVAVVAAAAPLLLRTRFPFAAPTAVMVVLAVASITYCDQLRAVGPPVPRVT